MTGASDAIDFGKVFLVAGISVLAGVFLGSRTGGTYEFEVGNNLAQLAFYLVIVGAFMLFFYMFAFTMILKMKQKHEFEMAKNDFKKKEI